MPTQDLDLSVFNAEYKNMKKIMDSVRAPHKAGASKSFALFQEKAKDAASENFVDSWLNQKQPEVPAAGQPFKLSSGGVQGGSQSYSQQTGSYPNPMFLMQQQQQQTQQQQQQELEQLQFQALVLQHQQKQQQQQQEGEWGAVQFDERGLPMDGIDYSVGPSDVEQSAFDAGPNLPLPEWVMPGLPNDFNFSVGNEDFSQGPSLSNDEFINMRQQQQQMMQPQYEQMARAQTFQKQAYVPPQSNDDFSQGPNLTEFR
mmetsp:Transcript_48856/g.71628  ORF Transcript_48856/g.71628 Transcript_48856/m.71628 type:complete len:257 (+) Transcript_48856:42-812(+)